MYQCKYCGRYLKNNYNNCPGCGAVDFSYINNFGTIEVTEVPKNGYKINIENLKKDNIVGIILLVMGIIFLGISLLRY